jgi:eukaryotic-like serine/threonine-protein kinase
MDPVSSPGQPLQVIGRYAIFGALASGGMATVHLGRLQGPAGFSRTVAIKRLHEHYATDPEFVAAFLDEARLAARIRHPNVVPTLDVVATQGQLFLVMEYVQGESVSRLLKMLRASEARIPLRMAVAIVAGALHGLHAAHEARNEKGEPLELVHRDVSPQNILLGVDGVPRVLDFGVAKAVGRLQSTETGRVKGKFAYMSPEQLRAAAVDRRTDVFAASIVLWEVLTGERLFGADNEGAVLERVIYSTIEPPSRRVPDISPELDAIVMRGLDRDVEHRWQSARDMAMALEECVPLPSAAQIGNWLETIAHDSLLARAERVAEVESATSEAGERVAHLLSEIRTNENESTRSLGPPSSHAPEVATGSRSAAVTMSAASDARAARRRALPLLALLAVLVCVGLAGAFILGRRGAAPLPATTISNASPIASIPTVPSALYGAQSAADSASAAPSVAESASPPPAAAPDAVKRKPKAVSARKVTPAAPAVDCSIPFTRDDLGRKIWKKECLK